MSGRLALLCLLTACSSSPPAGSRGTSDTTALTVTSDSVRREILAALERYYADFSARDWKAFETHFWPAATLTTIWQPAGEPTARVVVTSIKNFIAQTPQDPDSKPIFEERMLSAEVTAHANLAHVWARYEAKFGEPGAVATWRGVDSFTLMQHEGQWKIVSLAFTDQ